MSKYQTAVKRGLDSYDDEDGEREGLLPSSEVNKEDNKNNEQISSDTDPGLA